MTAVENIDVNAGFRVSCQHLVIKINALVEGDDIVDPSVKDLQICLGNGVEIVDGRAQNQLLLTLTAMVDVGEIGGCLASPARKIADGSECGDRPEIFGAEARHHHCHVTTTAETYKENVIRVDILARLDIIDGVLNVLLCRKRGAGKSALRITSQIGASELGEQKMKILLLCEFQ